ncbi:MAG: IS630 family transposase [Terriglobales bacterium]
MAAPISLREDFDGPMLRTLALSEKAGSVTRRLLALVTIYDGGTRGEAARLGGVGLQTIRDWVLRFNAEGPDGLIDGESTGRPSILNNEQRRALIARVKAGPIPAIHEVVRWRLIDLAQWVFAEYGLSVTKQILSRELRALGYRKLSARPRHHEHDEAAVAAFKKKFPDLLADIAAANGKPLELWFQDEARIGQKNKITRRWAERGTRPFALKDQRTASAYIFGAICPTLGKAAGLVLPFCNTEAMELHLQEIALAVEPGAHAVLFVDQAGWHVTAKLEVPENMTLVPLPAKSPELNPVENIWQYMRDNWLSNRIFSSYEDIVDHCCFNWNKLVDRPWLIMAIGIRDWAHGFSF